MNNSRRRFLRNSCALGALGGLGDFSFLGRMRPLSAVELQSNDQALRMHEDVAPVVRFIEETPRDRLLEEAAHRLQKGLSYQHLLAGLMLAGVKNIEPRPSVGFKFHAVLVVNSAHLASMSSPPEHRWLPIFWALDHYKSSAERDVQERGDWTMSPVKESELPPAHHAAQVFQQAMEQWDEQAADAAVARLARSASAAEVYEMFWRFGARDFRSIGHKAIYVANSWRTMQCIGWRHAEPILRSLAYALLMHEGDNPANRDSEADRPYRRNQELADQIQPTWRDAPPSHSPDGDATDAGAVNELMQTLRGGSNDDACDLVVKILNRGAGPQAIWDALLSTAGECLMRQPGIVGLHAVTTTNALHYAYQTTGDDRTRRLMMLQNAAFLPMFLGGMRGRGQVADTTLDALQPDDSFQLNQDSLGSIFQTLGDNRQQAAQQALAYLRAGGSPAELIDAARLLVFTKGDDAHDYKFSSAVLEDYYNVSKKHRDAYLAANLFLFNDAKRKDNQLVQRIQQALA